MRTLLALLMLAALALPTTGCIVVPATYRRGPRPRAYYAPSCPPSHYWDGRVCRHRGQGKGARKHDVHGAVPVN